MKKIAFLLTVLTAMLAIIGCPDIGGGGGGGSGVYPTKKFWAQNALTEAYYQLDAEMLASNTRCEVWAEKGSGVTEAKAKSVASEYANNIYAKMIDAFGENVTASSKSMNSIEYAHYLATGKTSDAKLTILLLDIKDGYKPGVNESFVAGYFWPGNLLSTVSNSNQLDMICIDTNPGLNYTTNAYMTLAHELQHLMNFVSGVIHRSTTVGNVTTIDPMDTWINEGLSSAAEWLYLGAHNRSKTEWYNNNGEGGMKGKIDVGNNFYVWNNRVTDSDPYPVLDDYATVYLFFQWLRLQSSRGIYKDIIKSEHRDNRAVINAISGYSGWEAMIRDWLAANKTNSPTGRDGYKGDATLKNISAPYAPTTPTTLPLYPGEGVYSFKDTDPSFSGPGTNIRYYYLESKNTLLTYNVNTDREGSSENGQTTGMKPSVIVTGPGSHSLLFGSSVIPGPFPIGMGDVIRTNNNSNGFDFNITKFETVSDE
jgi:hypothetical protein